MMRVLFVFLFLLGLVSCGHNCSQWEFKKVKTFHKNGKLKSELECYVRTCPNKGKPSEQTRIKKGIYYHKNGLVKEIIISDKITFKEERGYKFIEGGIGFGGIDTNRTGAEYTFFWSDKGERIGEWRFKCGEIKCIVKYSRSGGGSIFYYQIVYKDGTFERGDSDDVRRNPKFIRQFTECDDLKKLLSSFGVVEKKKGGLSEALDNLTIY